MYLGNFSSVARAAGAIASNTAQYNTGFCPPANRSPFQGKEEVEMFRKPMLPPLHGCRAFRRRGCNASKGLQDSGDGEKGIFRFHPSLIISVCRGETEIQNNMLPCDKSATTGWKFPFAFFFFRDFSMAGRAQGDKTQHWSKPMAVAEGNQYIII